MTDRTTAQTLQYITDQNRTRALLAELRGQHEYGQHAASKRSLVTVKTERRATNKRARAARRGNR